MERISSNATLFFKFFVPVFWIVFVGAVTTASMLYEFNYVGNVPSSIFRIVILAIFLSGVVFFVFTLLRLKRAEMDLEYVYVTNYFKTYRYPHDNIDRIELYGAGPFSYGCIKLRRKGTFGKKLYFIPSRSRIDEYFREYPQLEPMLRR